MLYRYEVKGIQSFILRSSRLKDIAAASALVVSGLEEARATLLERTGGELLWSAAGGATLRFPTAAAASGFAEVWPLVVRELLPGPQVIGAVSPDLGGLAPRLHAARNQPMVEPYDAGPFVARSGRTGGLAVARGRGGYHDAVHEVLEGRDQERGFEDLLLAGTALEGHRFLRETNDLGGLGYLALLHIDGNGIGKEVVRLTEQGDVDAFKAFSLALGTATEDAVRQGLLAVFSPSEDEVLSCRPVVVGGDDVTILLPPAKALPFVRAYTEAFESACQQHAALGDFTASAGVLFVKNKAPYYAVYETCEELVGWVKNATDRTCSALAVHRVTMSPHERLEVTMKRSLAARGADLPIFLGGPYTLREREGLPSLGDLLDLVQACSRLPRGGLREWLRVRQEDGERAKLRWQRLGEVLGDSREWARVEAFLEDGHWRKGGPEVRQRTPLQDVLNLLTLTGGEA